MLSEIDCNLFIKKSLDWGYKMSDSNSATRNKTIKRAFDGFGTLRGISVYWESKYFPEPRKRVGFKALFERKHQVENLIELSEKYKKYGKPVLSLFCIFIRVASQKVHLHIITNDKLKEMYLSKEKSFIVEEISEFDTILSTNLDNETIDLWKLLSPGE
jgi:hypothetical protein